MAIASSFSLGGIILLIVLGVGIFFMIGMLFDINLFALTKTNAKNNHLKQDLHSDTPLETWDYSSPFYDRDRF